MTGQQALREFFRELPQWKAHSRMHRVDGQLELCLDTEALKAFVVWSQLKGYGNPEKQRDFLAWLAERSQGAP